MKAKVIQAVEDAMVDAVMDSAAGLGLTPLQRAKFIVAISETLIDAVSPYVQSAEAPEAPKAAKRTRGPRKVKNAVKDFVAQTLNGQQPLPNVPLPPPVAAPAPDVSQPAPFKAPPAVAQPFSG